MSELVTIPAEELEDLKDQLLELDMMVNRLLAQPLVHAVVVRAENSFRLDAFEKGDRMMVIDRELRRERKYFGKISSEGVSEDGWVVIQYPNGERDRLNIGMNGKVPQCKLLGKNDGMNVTISHDQKLFEVHGLPDKQFKVGATVKVDMETKQIHDDAGVTAAGNVANIKSLVDETHIEVECQGQSRVVIYGIADNPAKVGERVMLDNSNTLAIRLLEKDGKDRYSIVEPSVVTWDRIAGLGDVKEQMVEALETPYLHPEIYRFYGKKPPKGILLYGPPGCGKTLIGKATANSLARIHGKENFQSGFMLVKGPELLVKWVGDSEAAIRSLFARGEEHYQKHGYPAIIFMDEADALLKMRGSGRVSDMEDTIVPMFLSEMDGIETSHTMVVLATNQPKRLDPAVTREGRVDRHIKVRRPNVNNAHEYFNLYLQNIPLLKGVEPEELVTTTVKDLFSERRELYQIIAGQQKHSFTLGHSATGAMISALVDHATSNAMKRDMANGVMAGVTIKDFSAGVDSLYRQHADLNSTFDLEDFCDENKIDRNSAKFAKVQL